ncbi:SCO family protein [Subsaxibacter sp. CAU 1640]|uniref:SCO family protein n=1 Tax=Subsaxibacter sp. CAU 1640 TaxID=2933271 RepID=UPI002005BE1E|nr:SCO family protein [Subsaxibacter sp. CAU 1640]MCK7589855.1 SCO family protein [Subsaxibacter sp. CAU 1640]
MKFLKVLVLFFFFGCNSGSKQLPILSYQIDDKGNTVAYKIKYDNFKNQLGENFSTDNIKDKVFLANFFFTSCPSICPPMRNKLIDIAETFQSDDDFLIVSHTIDPKNDTVEVLKNYSEATGISSDKWQFVRSSVELTRKQADLYMTNFKANEDGTDFYHSSYAALVDTDQQIRGFYNLLVDEEIERLKEDIAFLLKTNS